MRKTIFVILFILSLTWCFANGGRECCEQLEQQILMNKNVLSVKVHQYSEKKEYFYADVYLQNGGYLSITKFEKNLSGNYLGVNYVGRDADGLCEYLFAQCRCANKTQINDIAKEGWSSNLSRLLLSVFLNRDVSNVNDIINCYNEIYMIAEILAKETPEDRSERRNLWYEEDEKIFLSKLGNCISEDYRGAIFVREFSKDVAFNRAEPMFADE